MQARFLADSNHANMNRRYLKTFAGTTALLLIGSGMANQAWSKPRHRVDHSRLAAPELRRSNVRDQDPSIPTGFVDVSRDSSGVEHSQGMLAVSPTSPNSLATLFYDTRSAFGVQAASSQDGGNTWALSTMPSSVPSVLSNGAILSDPTTTVDSLGRFFVGGGGPDPVSKAGETLSVFVMRSDDGGQSFTALNPPSAAITETAGQTSDFLDHQSNWADSSGVTSNDYVSASAIATNSKTKEQTQVVLFNESTNGGSTWVNNPTSAVQVNDDPPSPDEGSSTPDTRTDSHGKVYVDWTQINAANQITVVLDKANVPAGGKFGTDVVVAGPLNANPNYFTGYLGDIRAGVFNTLAVDTGSTSTNGDVYECWTDQEPNLGSTLKVLVARSTDGGNTFSAPIRVDTSMDTNGTASDHQTIPTIAINPATGQVVVSYYSTHLNPTTRGGPASVLSVDEIPNETPLVDLLIAVGTPNSSGSLDFAGPYRVSKSSIDVLAADKSGNFQYDPALGDYNGFAFRGVTGGINTAVEFSTVDSDNRIVEIANQQFDGSGNLAALTGGTYEFTASATAPVAGLAASISWGDGTTSTGLDVTHNYAGGTFTAVATIADGSTSYRTFSYPVTSTGAFATSGSIAATSTVNNANSLVALTASSPPTSTSTTSGTSGTTVGTSGSVTSGSSSVTTGTGTSGTGTSGTGTGTAGTTSTTGTSGSTTIGGTSGTGTTTSATGTSTNSGGGGCFIATAAYGSYWEPHVMTLRHFRDDQLLTNVPGRLFVQEYYQHSPPIAEWIRHREWARGLVRLSLDPMVFSLEHSYLAMFSLLGSLSLGFGVLGYRRNLV
jgi:hypothetical protein